MRSIPLRTYAQLVKISAGGDPELNGEIENQAAAQFSLKANRGCITFPPARAHGLWTYEPRQGRKAATVVCSTSAVVTLATFLQFAIDD